MLNAELKDQKERLYWKDMLKHVTVIQKTKIFPSLCNSDPSVLPKLTHQCFFIALFQEKKRKKKGEYSVTHAHLGDSAGEVVSTDKLRDS